MNREDAEKIVKALSEKPFVCGDGFIETDNGYVISKKSVSKGLELKK